MPECKPTLGYPTRTAAAVALRLSGLAPNEIGLRIGGKSKDISALLRVSTRRTIHFPRDVLDGLEPHAKERGVTVSALAVMMIVRAVDDDMVDAILDDREAS